MNLLKNANENRNKKLALLLVVLADCLCVPMFAQSGAPVIVSAGSFAKVVSPGSIAYWFGQGLADFPAVAAVGGVLPLQLPNLQVTVNGNPAGLFQATANQVTFLVPDNVTTGTALVTIVKDGQFMTSGSVLVDRTSPALFSVECVLPGGAAPVAWYR